MSIRWFGVLLLSAAACSGLQHETASLRVSQSAVEYINSELKKVIPTIESELQNYPLPEVSGNDFRLYNLRLHSTNLGNSRINFQDHGLRFQLYENRFVFGGNFWVRKIIGIQGQVTITASNFGVDTSLSFNGDNIKSLRLNDCRVNVQNLNIDLHNPILNFITGILRGAITDQARRMICDAVRDTAVPAINAALQQLPSHYNVGDFAKIVLTSGSASVTSDRLLTSAFAVVQPNSGDKKWDFRDVSMPTSGYPGQCCFWISEYLLNSGLGTLVPEGKLATSYNVAQLAGLPAALNVGIRNSAAPVVRLSEEYVYLNTLVNMSLKGDNNMNLGDYSTNVYIQSETDITFLDFQRMVKNKINYDILDLYEREECVDNHKRCKYWAGIGECAANPNYMLVHCRKSCGECEEEDNPDDLELKNPLQYLLNNVLPSKDYVQFHDAKSDMLNGASRTCGKFRPTDKLRQIIHQQIRDFLRSRRN